MSIMEAHDGDDFKELEMLYGKIEELLDKLSEAGMTHRAIAHELGITRQCVYETERRAINKIREEFARRHITKELLI